MAGYPVALMTQLAIGLIFDLLGSYPRRRADPPDVDAEYEPEETIRALEAAIRLLGHEPVRIGNPDALLARLGKGELPALDAALNIAEGRGGRNREAWAPILLEMAGIPTLGSDALTLSLTLDKAWASTLVSEAGVPVPKRCLLESSEYAKNAVLPGPFPLFVKPRWEGTAKGIGRASKVADRGALLRAVGRIRAVYRQPALVEEFLPGAEYTVTVVGNDPPRALPVLQRALDAETGIGIHAIDAEAPPDGFRAELPGELTAALEADLARLAVRAYTALECVDFARADFKFDRGGEVRFLEMNPLPSFAPDGTFGILAELEGRPVEALMSEVIATALVRLGFQGAGLQGAGPRDDSVAKRRVLPEAAAVSGAAVGSDERDWGWQMRNRIRTAVDLERYVRTTPDERGAIDALADRFHFVITPYYASLMDADDPECPIRRQVVPRSAELDDPVGWDPLGEVEHSPVKNVIRVYPDRIAFCVNNECALYCRFCLRKRMVGEPDWTMKKRELTSALDWIRSTPEIRDVLLTGGDPLVFSDDRLEWLLGQLRAIPHVEIIRLGTRLPVTLPYRITDELCRMLERFHPIWVNTHFNHPKELTEQAAEACDRLTRAGIPVGNQSVLMRGINDNVDVMKELCEGLVRMRVRPYYCYQAQMLEGTGHFRVPIERGLEIFRSLRGRTSGFAIPLFVLDTPHGKVPISYPYYRGREGNEVIVESFDGHIWREPNPLDDDSS
ncbi:MAG: KamA family radical SAM protein [Myxococcota bacterium]